MRTFPYMLASTFSLSLLKQEKVHKSFPVQYLLYLRPIYSKDCRPITAYNLEISKTSSQMVVKYCYPVHAFCGFCSHSKNTSKEGTGQNGWHYFLPCPVQSTLSPKKPLFPWATELSGTLIVRHWIGSHALR